MDNKKIEVASEAQKDDIINFLRWKNTVTHLPNRDSLVIDLETLIKEKREGFNLIVFNLNFFGRINFTYGHDHGNNIINSVVEFLYTVGFTPNNKDMSIYSISGVKFAATVPKEKTDKLITALKDRFKDPWKTEDIEQFISVSIGVAKIDDFTDNAEKYIYKATYAAGGTKNARNSVCYYQNTDLENLIKNTQLEYYLRRAVKYNLKSFIVYYQPLIETKTGKVDGFEALCRWKDDELGFVYPSEFISLAEYLGLINVIDMHVISEAAKFTKKMHDKGHYITMSANISARSLFEEGLVDRIKNIIANAQLEYSYVNIEITESEAITNLEDAIKIIKALKALGCGVHLDDFGVGHSSLSALKEMPVTTLKIDRSFTSEMHKTKFTHTFVRTIIDLAHSADMKVCTEGVETQEDYMELKNLKSDLLQGYYFSPPIPEAEAMKLVTKVFS